MKRPTAAIKAADIQGAKAITLSNRLERAVIALKPMDVTTPIPTIVSARPIENALTKVMPKVSCPRCKQSKKTVIAAGQGINPPVRP
ncbi:MAG: hypothetical protein AAFY09_13660, partial [Pseudomonadota bacterium]